LLRTIDELLELIKDKAYLDSEKIIKAYNFADELHKGQLRRSGDPYITHPLSVAEIVVELQLDTDSVCAALLHDTVEDCSDKMDNILLKIKKIFGNDVADIVDGITKLIHITLTTRKKKT